MKKVPITDLTSEEIIKRLNNEEIIYCDGSNGITYKKYNDFLCRFENNKCTNINADIPYYHFYYFLDKKPLNLEVNKFYKTKSGLKVYCYAYVENDGFPYKFVIPINTAQNRNDCLLSTDEFGRNFGNNTPSDNDIIEEWED